MNTSDRMSLAVRRKKEVSQDIFSYELVAADGSAELPAFDAGAHVSVTTPSGLAREYSICNAPSERHRYVIAVKRDAQGRGGSISMVDGVREGDSLESSIPRNYFQLDKSASRFLFIAGGIGITPILSMIRDLQQEQREFRLIYCTRSPEMTAFREELSAPGLAGKVVFHHDHGERERSLDFSTVLLDRPEGAQLYCCGPGPLMHAVRDNSRHWPQASVHFEDFGSTPKTETTGEKTFVVRLVKKGISVDIPPGVTILDALRAEGVDVPSSCESGTCGTCRTTVLGGVPEHRDFILEEDEKGEIMICISRAKSQELLLDL